MLDEAGPMVEKGTRVVLLQEQGWPRAAGVCCWRHGVTTAFTAAGAQVDVVTAAAPRPAAKAAGGAAAAKLNWLPGPVRRPIGFAYRGSRKVAQRVVGKANSLRTKGKTGAARSQLATAIGEASLVLAESPQLALLATQAGVPGVRVWALALPAARIHHGDTSHYARLIGRLAPMLGGFLTESETARESIERAATASRPVVLLYPPLAADRPCPHCGTAAPGTSYDEPQVLALWRGLLEPGAQAPEFSFAADRLPRPDAGWARSDRWDWTQAQRDTPWDLPADGAPGWTAQSQDTAARELLKVALPGRPATPRARRTTLISGYDLKFIRELSGRLDNRTDLRMLLDEWPRLGGESPQTAALLERADTVVAEWARPSAVWLSKRKRPGQNLIVRLHRYELDAPYPRQIEIDKVDAVVHVSPPIAARIRNELGWPAEKLVYIPNFLDVDWLDRPKLPGARFGIGMVGIEFMNKRFDFALDLLARVRREDPRFTLFVRTKMPWENIYSWQHSHEQTYVAYFLERIERDPLLRGGVIFDQPGRDMARWYRRVGQVLSMSDIESFHLAAAEGMASGAVPVIRPWPGSHEIYGGEWIEPSLDDAVASVLANADPEVWAKRAAAARAEIRAAADPVGTINAWADLMHGDLDAARSYFGSYVPKAA
ncbi:hypothetical protein Cs7R123_77850 [Catellatospora sp. TT07R-123]|uniref:hypothetical protein n=1 Tax=Catellatospora sp. TT07R-123 TaxID=2733863 RepID=UPI001B19971D|nr:hypothetical protein [Catellatospora sp. TT07R-123]GHJ50443.1 hypothetical protein Cs7R123_77850 [Catellatospora sp. TT07R-123]